MTLRKRSNVSVLALALVAGVALVPATLPAQDDALASRYILELQQMREELRELRGLVESQAQEIENLKRRQRDQYLDLDSRLGEISSASVRPSSAVDASQVPLGPGPMSSSTGATAAAASEPDGAETAPLDAPPPPGALPEVRDPLDESAEITTLPAASTGADRELEPPTEVEQQAYDQAFLALRETRYADAAEGFDRFLRDHPQSSYAPNALYWLGEVYYVTRDFETALAQFERLLGEYPGSTKSPDALLKIGFSHYELGHWNEARASLEEVAERYPGTNYSRLAENRLRTMRLEGRL